MPVLVRSLSALPALVALAFFAVVVTAPPTLSGIGYATGILVVAAAGVASDAHQRRVGRRVGMGLVGVTLVARLVVATGSGELRMATPGQTTARLLDRALDEADLSVNAARALAWTRFVKDPDVPDLARVMRGAYARMREDVGSSPSPALATYAGLEGPGADDTITVGDVAASEGVVVFLHGFAGSFTLPCWVVAKSAAAAGFATVCPSTRWVGDWWSRDGEATLRETVTDLEARGARRVVLAGLSNGGIGASLLALRMRGAFDGLVVLSGASPEAGDPGIPVLAIQGEHDAQISASVVRAYAGRVHGRYVSLDAGHFAMLRREGDVSRALSAFLRALPPRRPHPSETARRDLPR